METYILHKMWKYGHISNQWSDSQSAVKPVMAECWVIFQANSPGNFEGLPRVKIWLYFPQIWYALNGVDQTYTTSYNT